MRIHGSTVLITGASMGIGAACATEFARHGATVVLAARSRGKLEAVAANVVGDGGCAYTFGADLSTLEGAQQLAAGVSDGHGTPDILVNNAGAGRFISAFETTPAEFGQMAALPYLAAGYLTTAFLPAMVSRNSGHIVNINSPASRVVWPSAAGYSAARWALRGLTEGLRADLRSHDIGVCEVVPGEVSSQYFVNNPGSAENVPQIGKLLPRLTPEQVAAKVVRAVAYDREDVIFPFLLRVMAASARIAPRLTKRLVAATGTRK